jgi:hypothetical protein
MTVTRWKAFLIHLGLCAAIYVVLLYLIVFVWYPQPYFAADGGWQGVRLVTGVDLVLGPLLTLIVFKPGKPGLKRDLALIGLLQSVALVWGTWLVYDQRTAMVTFADNAFYSLVSEQVQDAGGQAPEVAAQSVTNLPYAFVRLPTDPRERREFRLKIVLSATPLYLLGDRYEPLGPTNLPEVLAQSLDIAAYAAASDDNRQELERFLARHGGEAKDYAFLPLHCRYRELVLAVRRADGGIVDGLDIDPAPPHKTNAPAKPGATTPTHPVS